MLYVKKSMGGAILFPLILGPIGLLYASFWIGFVASAILLVLITVPHWRQWIILLWILGPYISTYVVHRQATKKTVSDS